MSQKSSLPQAAKSVSRVLMSDSPEAAHGGATEQEPVRFDVFSGGLHETLSLILNGLMIAALTLASVTDMGLAYQ
jgi:hypothetical protein